MSVLQKFFLLLLVISPSFAEDRFAGSRQMIVVTTRDWDEIQGTIELFERSDDSMPWKRVCAAMQAVVGKKGFAWGVGLHGKQKKPYLKIEGDKKAPAGIFSIGTAFGFAQPSEMASLRMGYLHLEPTTEAVDDQASAYYNSIVDRNVVICDWKSSEKMGLEPLYALGFTINHNFPKPIPGAGSAIFFHIWRNDHSGTAGCTATSRENVSSIVSWLDREKNPIIVQLPLCEYASLEDAWHLPKLCWAEKFDLVNVATICPPLILDIRYATSNNFMGKPLYPKAVCYLHKNVAEELKAVQEELSLMNIRLKIFDGYRPLSVQQLMWDAVRDERYVSNPAVNKGRHTRGTAVDVTLVDSSNNELEMTSPYDDFSEKAHSDYMGGTQKALQNRDLLKEVMAKHHFKQIKNEWWHFDFDGWKDDGQFPPLDISFERLEESQ